MRNVQRLVAVLGDEVRAATVKLQKAVVHRVLHELLDVGADGGGGGDVGVQLWGVVRRVPVDGLRAVNGGDGALDGD